MENKDQASLFDPGETEITVPEKVGPGPHFERFWQAYPRKVAKGAAKKAWEKAVKGMDKKELDDFTKEVVNAVHAQRDWRDRARTDPSIHVPDWKHPSTWLNGMCWLDELQSLGSGERGKIELPECSEHGCHERAANTYTDKCAYHFSEQNESRYGNCADFQMLRDYYRTHGLAPKQGESREEWMARLRQTTRNNAKRIGV
jgi:hypothetical protein